MAHSAWKFHCLQNKPSKYSTQIISSDCVVDLHFIRCGNMVIDEGEECDCGLASVCKSHCCNPRTCRFIEKQPPVQCASGGCCNLQVNRTRISLKELTFNVFELRLANWHRPATSADRLRLTSVMYPSFATGRAKTVPMIYTCTMASSAELKG